MGYVANILYGVIAVMATAVITWWVHGRAGWPWPVAYLAAINGVAFIFYGFDKIFVGVLIFLRLRVPEGVLVWLLAFPGGMVGAVLGMQIFHHKTGPETQSFRVELWRAVFVQVCSLAGAMGMYLITR